MGSPIALLTGIILAVIGLALLIYLFSRAVLWARKGRGGAESVAGLVGSIDLGSALNPAQEVMREKRRVKRSEEGSGDPDERGS
jgi:hypothetical protein